jgi:hypothetical protein
MCCVLSVHNVEEQCTVLRIMLNSAFGHLETFNRQAYNVTSNSEDLNSSQVA